MKLRRILFAIVAICAAIEVDLNAHPEGAGSSTTRPATGPARIIIDERGASNPWTHLNFRNDPNQFQFAIVTDRTGAPRPGIFETAVTKLNLLRPEFVMSVGDLIQGRSGSQAAIDYQWNQFESFVKRLDMPFFYVPGNHDMATPPEVQTWMKRFGRDYFHFIYRNVLFLCLNTELDGRAGISLEQIGYFRKVLAENKDVKWTLVFQHRPLWTGEKDPTSQTATVATTVAATTHATTAPMQTNWREFEKLLLGRKYTVFAGHNHTYTKWNRAGQKYIVLATTGGGSRIEGPVWGSFDHVAWVTMTHDGPLIANVMLDGVWDENVATTDSLKLVRALRSRAKLSVPPLMIESPTFEKGAVTMKLTNDADLPMQVICGFEPNEKLNVRPHGVRVTVPPNSVDLVELQLEAKGSAVNVAELTPVTMDSVVSFKLPDQPVLEIKSKMNVAVEAPYPIEKRASPVVVDGKLDEWTLPLVVDAPAQLQSAGDTWQGPSDCSFRFNVAADEKFLYVAVDVMDDIVMLEPTLGPRQQDLVEVRVDARPMEQRKATPDLKDELDHYVTAYVRAGQKPEETSIANREKLPKEFAAVGLPHQGGYSTEMAIPIEYLKQQQGGDWESVRINIIVNDADEQGYLRDLLYWKPGWMNPENYAGSGTFHRAK
jgi:hypothetical protein